MWGFARLTWMAFVGALLLPAAAYAQASITGVVKDTSGAVLPGVTVEAASPALIEKTRSVVSDGTGQYRIVDLRPGTYTVTFTLSGFATVRREGIELTGTFTASVNAELRVGALEETITVTGETPIVDVQGTDRHQVLTQELIESVPVSRAPGLVGALVPGMNVGSADVGGTAGNPFTGTVGALTIHGSRSQDYMVMVNGIDTKNLETGGGGQTAMNMALYQETVVQSFTVSAEQGTGGAQVNLIPREGGNTFNGSFFGAFANHSLQSSNFSQDLKDRGLGTPDHLRKSVDVTPAYGGPIKRDRLWFFTTGRYWVTETGVPMFHNLNAFNPDVWTYNPDTSRPAFTKDLWLQGAGRVTWQAAPKHKLAFMAENQCGCPFWLPGSAISATRAPEAATRTRYRPIGSWDLAWTAPLTNRLLFEAMVYRRYQYSRRLHPEGPLADIPDGVPVPEDEIRAVNAMRLAEGWIGVLDQASGISYRAITGTSTRNRNSHWASRASVSYITGAHAFKVGYINTTGHRSSTDLNLDAPIDYRFNNGVPNQLTLYATPVSNKTNQDLDLGIYAQDRWTIERLTLSYGSRYEHYKTSFPQFHVGPGVFAPTRNITFPATEGVSWHDVTPRMGAAYDLFGNGKTALKVNLTKHMAVQYLAATGDTGVFGRNLNPALRLVNSTNRSWNDANGNFIPDCDLLNREANGECGVMSNRAFGSTRSGATYDPETLKGWGHRIHNWQFSASVQHELLPRVSADVGYFRRWYGNFVVTDDRAVAPTDFDPFSIVAPVDPRLPGGGGYAIAGLYDLTPAKFGVPADNYITFADNYGKQIEHWNGLDVTLNARPRPEVLLMGGLSTGRTTTDNCDVVAKLDNPSQLYCRRVGAFRTQVKLTGTYTVPRVDVLISGTWQNLPGPQISANYVASNTEVRPSLGRNLAGGARNVTVNVVEPGTMYGERRNQVDLRFGKILRYGSTRTTLNIELYNALNAAAVLGESPAFATWRRPQSILQARLVKFALQFDF